MAPHLLESMEAAELRETAARIREFQVARKLSDNALLKKLPQLGSTKTFTRILKDDLAELDLEKQLSSYRAALAFIESLDDSAAEAEEIYEDLFPVLQLRRCFADTLRESGPARCIFLVGPSGSGKTCAQRYLLNKFGARLVQIEASTTWNDSPGAMLQSLLERLGVREVPISQLDRQNKAIEKLNESRRCVLIEEAHHMGPRLLNVVITLINQTPGEFVLAAIDTLWRRLETRAYEECRQLTGNRLAEKITLGSEVRAADAEKLMSRRVKWANGDLKAALKIACERANMGGRLAFIRETIKRANVKADGDPVTLELWADAVQEEVASR